MAETVEYGATRGAPAAGLRYMAAGAFFFSVMSVLVKIAGERLPSMEIVLARAVVTLVLTGWGLWRAGVSPWGRNRRLLVVRGLAGFVALSCFYYAVVHLPLADATVIQYTNPVFAALLAVPFLGERVRAREAAAVVTGLAGVVLVARPAFLFGESASALDPFAAGIALLGAAMSGAAYVTVRRLGATEHPLVIVFAFSLISTVGAFPVALPGLLMPTPTEWLVLLGVGVATQLGQVAITHGLARERAGRATAVGYLQIVFAAVWGVLFFAEVPDGWTFAGAVVVVGATLMVARGR